MQLERYIPRSLDGEEETARRPFLGRQFGARPAAPPPEPPPPSFTEAELKAAEADAYRKGFVAGEQEGKAIAEAELAQVDRQIAGLMQPLADALVRQREHYNVCLREVAALMPNLAFALARKIAGDALQADALPLVSPIAERCIATMLGAPKIVVTVDEKIVERFEARLHQQFASREAPGEVIIHGEAFADPAMCRIEWSEGAAHIATADRLAQLDRLVQEMAALGRLHYQPLSGEASPEAPPQPAAEGDVHE